jgi:hypothetical protein
MLGIATKLMTKKAYKLAALFFFIIGVASILAAISMGADRVFHSPVSRWYLIIGIMGLMAARAVRLGASRKT